MLKSFNYNIIKILIVNIIIIIIDKTYETQFFFYSYMFLTHLSLKQ